MSNYLYVLNVEKPFTETELNNVKDEICRVFECTQINVSEGGSFTLHSPLGPEKLPVALRDLSTKLHVQFRAGGKID